MFIRDLQNNEYFLEGVVSHDQELNGDERIDIDIHYTDNNAEFLSKQDDLKMWTIIFENKEYKIISSKMTGKGNKYTVSVTAILYVLDWLNSNRIYQRIDASLTTTEAFNLVFDNSPFTYITVNSASSERFEGLGDGETRLEVFKTLIDRYGYEMNIVGNVVYLQSQVGNDTNFEYRYKVNASNITKETNAADLWTYVKGYADYDDNEEDAESKAKIKREYVSPLESIIGSRRHAPPVKDGRVKYNSVLDKKMKEVVDNSVQISFSADINDMSQHGYDYQHAVVGDRVFLVDERIGLNTEIRVVQISRTINANGELRSMEITFGTQPISDTYSANFNNAVSSINDLLNGRKVLPFAALDIVSKSMVSKIQATTSEIVYDNNGQHFIEKSNNNNIMTMNSSGLLLSTDGGRTAKTAITAEGIVADTITSGSLLTSLVDIVGRNGLITMNGDEFKAFDNTTKSQTTIKPSGLYVTRPDGAQWIANGVPKMALDIQRNQFIQYPVEFGGQNYLMNTKLAGTEFKTFENFFGTHQGRYLRVTFGISLNEKSASNSAFVECRLQEFGSNETNKQATSRVTAYKPSIGDTVSTSLQIDLGVPTYQDIQYYIQFRALDDNYENWPQIRVNRVYIYG